MSTFEELYAIDVSGRVEKKKSGNTELTYLSWAWAWAELVKKCPGATYEIVKFDGLPYVYDPATGYMVYTRVTVDGLTHEMWLPVMDGANRAMKAEPYEFETKYNGTKTVDAATMFDINKTIMRCLVKNLAMFGLGLYIYAGEDLPEVPKLTDKTKQEALLARAKELKITQKDLFKVLGVNKIEDTTLEGFMYVIDLLDKYEDKVRYTTDKAGKDQIDLPKMLALLKADSIENLGFIAFRNVYDVGGWDFIKGKCALTEPAGSK